MLHAMIMAGGGGTRFWPRSRQARPKQFLTLGGERSLLQQALDRIEAAVPAEHTWVITGEAYRAETNRQLPGLPADHVVGEPCGRDTAPCIGLGAALIARHDPEAVMLVTPADHVIEPVREFERAVRVAAQMAEEYPQALITFGIPPTFPSTGYGYIQRGPQAAQRQGVSVYRVPKKDGFREKPDADLAERFVASGEYYWNSGIFVWKARAVLAALAQQRLALHAAVQRIAEAWATPRRQEVLEKEYASIERISIDYAVMEKAPEVLVVQAPYRWDDVGSWLALERMHPQDADGNTVLAAHCGLRTHDCVIVAEPGRLVTTIGVNELLIIQDGDCTLVADRRDEGAVKQLVDELKKKGLGKYL
jgi:mannose-1-phosphate guanylyltransferase